MCSEKTSVRIFTGSVYEEVFKVVPYLENADASHIQRQNCLAAKQHLKQLRIDQRYENRA